MSAHPTANETHPGLNLHPGHGDAHGQAEEKVFGFWVFMMSDAILFGLLMATYAAMLSGTAGGPGPKELFELASAAVQTAVLLASSFTFGMASLALKYEHPTKRVVLWLLVTLGLGATFLALELRDFAAMVEAGAVPSRSGYLSAFWALVPLHGLHVTLAIVWMLSLFAQVAIYGLDADAKHTVLRLGILWHFLDVVWVAIVSLVYLGGLA